LRWLGLSFVPSSLLLGVTHHITTDIAPIPLLWVIPLSLYLLTFVVVFARKPILQHEVMLRAQTYLALPPLLLYLGNLQIEVWIDFPVHLAAFFVCTMVCHGELAKSRPHPARLTEFYVWMAAGGVLGGIFTALLAPLIFTTVIEYPLMLVFACMLRPALRSHRLPLRVLLPGLLAAFILLPIGLMSGNRFLAIYLGSLSLILLSAFGGAVGFDFLRTPLRIGLGLGAFVLGGTLLLASQQDVLVRKRSFFGTLKVVNGAQNGFHLFYHGTTLQGAQAVAPEHRTEALTYHHKQGPLGQLLDLQLPSSAHSIAVFGLGVGTVAAYARPQDTITFYEIDENVEKVAWETDWFTYLHDCPGDVRVILGDARISVADAPAQQYDLIIQDAFSSDAIPVHLLTREAFRLYLEKLNDSGILTFNITNRYLNLEPVLAALIEDAGMVGLIRRDTELSEEARQAQQFPSVWVAAARREQALASLGNDPRWRPLQKQAGVRVWTDDYSNILFVLKSPFFPASR
jgi:spermidine synthase